MFFPVQYFKKLLRNTKMYCDIFDSCCELNDLLHVFIQTTMRIYFNHFSGDYYFTKSQVDDNLLINLRIFYILLHRIYMFTFYQI